MPRREMTESTQPAIHISRVPRGRAVERLVDIFFSPRAAFGDILEAPAFWVPLGALAVIHLAGNLIYFAPSLEPAKFALTILLNLLPALVSVAIGGVAYWLVLMLVGRTTSLSVITSVVAYSLMASEALSFCWALIEHFAGVPGAGSRGPIFSNLGFLVSPNNFALHRLLASFDVLALYYLALVWVGIARSAANLTTLLCGVIVIAPWILVQVAAVLIKVLVS